jgi:hypothetical protein
MNSWIDSIKVNSSGGPVSKPFNLQHNIHVDFVSGQMVVCSSSSFILRFCYMKSSLVLCECECEECGRWTVDAVVSLS